MSGQEFGRYRLDRLIGSGGMGDVYEALDLERDRVVALKLLPHLFSGNAEFQQRFRRESRVAARLRDPHIIPIHDYGEIDQRLYIDMRLVDGATVASLLRDEGPLSPARAVHLIGQVAEALDAAHADGLIHRDVKPSNILVTARDFVYVVDFGIAHAAGHTASGLTLSGSTVGTLDYMAPERFGNRALDRRADVYSLACVLHQCLTARTPFDGEDLPALMYAHLHVDPPAASREVAEVPAALDAVVARGMAKTPGDRFATAGDLADAARRALADEGSPGRESPDPPASGHAPVLAAVSSATGSPPKTPHDSAPSTPPTPSMPAPSVPAPSMPPAPARSQDDTRNDTRDEPPDEAPTRRVPADPPTRPAAGEPPERQGRQPGRGALVGIGAVVLVVLVAVVVGLIVADHPDPAAPPSGAQVGPPVAAPPASRPQPTVVATVATPPTPGYAAVAPGGRLGYVTSLDARLVTVFDLTSNAPVATIPIPQAPPRYVAFTADGSRAFVSAYTEDDAVNLVAVVDTATNTVITTIPVDQRPYALAVAPDQRTLWVPSHDTARIDLVDIATNTVTRRVPLAPNPHWIGFGGNRAYVSNHESNLVTVLDATTAAPITTIPFGPSPHAVAVSPDGSRVAVVAYDGDAVGLIDTATDRVVATVPVGHHPQHVTWAPDGRHLYTANVDGGSVSVVDPTTNQVTATVPVGRSPTSVTTVDPPGTSAMVTTLDDGHYTILGTGT